MSEKAPARSEPTSERDRGRYYAAAMHALRFVEQRSPTGRRFGADADARWGAFRGNLTTADRLDVLLRDADAQWPAAFAARNVFALRAAAEDEAFGAEWSPLDPVDAEELWRGSLAKGPPSSIRDVLNATGTAWGLDLQPFDCGVLGPTDKLLVAGPSAIASLIVAFSEAQAVDWADQVVCVASPAAHRQLAAMASALLNLTKPTVLVGSHALETFKPGLGRRALVSSDALESDAAWARSRAES